ncbi:MAG: TetR/AcrR family transcriptional regulator [Solirubrobacterales bacterium]|nr:TetR/AcrR family transcriptional regulator [Solirubrobacterales bacterium]
MTGQAIGRAGQGEITRARLIRTARELFAERGYGGAGTEEIVSRARVTRGALYHHFADKRDLFRAVYEQVEEEAVARTGARMAEAGDPASVLRTGITAFLDLCTEPAMARIALLDAPSVLGWQEWREIDLRYGLGLVVAGLRGGMDAGVIRPQPVVPLAHLLIGAISEAGMVIANADDPETARAEVESPLLGLLDGLQAPG